MGNAMKDDSNPLLDSNDPRVARGRSAFREQRRRLAEHEDGTGYGLKDGKLLFIAEVPRGLACDCVCVSCGGRLVAKKGFERRHHFAHRENTICRGAPESVLHLLSKEILAELDALLVPSYEFTKKRTTKAGRLVHHQITVARGGCVRVDSVTVEDAQDGFVPDIIIKSNSKRLIVEVAVSNKVTRAKLRRMRKRNLPAIEIRLDSSDSFLSRDELKAKLQFDLPSKAWLFHPAQRNAERSFLAKWRSAVACDRTRSHMPSTVLPTYAPTGPSPTSLSHLRPNWDRYDRAFDEFHRTHARYPTADECLRLWPQLFKPSVE